MPHRPLALALLIVLCALVRPEAASAEKRIGLVIGNGAYNRVPKLANPGNDAAAMEKMLTSAGFTEVVRANDLGVAAMRRALRDFSDLARDADMAVVFYAGHGLEVAGVNYLIPVDAALERDIDVQDEAISLDRLNQILEPVRRLRLIILDACRDNPFARSMRRTLTTRSVRSGYGEIDERSLPPNTLIAYAQRAGATADDGSEGNSPYTKALLKHLPVPGIDIELALRRVRDDVLKATRNRQEPFKYGSLGGTELPLVPRREASAAAAAATPSPQVPAPAETASSREWRGVDKASAAELETFLARHAASPEAPYARARLDDIRQAQAREAAQRAKEVQASQQKQREVAVVAPSVPAAPSQTPAPPVLTAFRVKSTVSQGIHNMRAGPGTGHALVASIPAGAGGVRVDLASCREADDGRSSNDWCRASWQGRSGWISMGGLTR